MQNRVAFSSELVVVAHSSLAQAARNYQVRLLLCWRFGLTKVSCVAVPDEVLQSHLR
jgi:hypothetical protein